MSSVSTSAECPECGEEIPDLEVEVSFSRQGHPYGSTTAYENLVEIEETGFEVACDCGYRFTAKETDKVLDDLIEIASQEIE